MKPVGTRTREDDSTIITIEGIETDGTIGATIDVCRMSNRSTCITLCTMFMGLRVSRLITETHTTLDTMPDMMLLIVVKEMTHITVVACHTVVTCDTFVRDLL